jgi:hypothetical protein
MLHSPPSLRKPTLRDQTAIAHGIDGLREQLTADHECSLSVRTEDGGRWLAASTNGAIGHGG